MRTFYTTARDLHLYVGLFLCPFIVLFAISTLLLNHGWFRSASAPPVTPADVAIQVPEGAGTLAQAKAILQQIGVTGEIDYVRHNAKTNRLFMPVSKPGQTTTVDVDLRAGRATIQPQETGLAGALSYLHRMPGPHNVRFRGNWIFMKWWSVVTDAAVHGLLFLTISGIYLWWILKAERTTGGILLAAGAATMALLVTALCTA